MHRALPPLFAVILLAPGCFAPGPGGVYTVMVYPSTRATSLDITHNYLDAGPADDDTTSDWTVTSEESESPQVLFAQVFGSDGEDARILVIDDRAYFGTADSEAWSFSWTSTTADHDAQSHVSGYTYDELAELEVLTTIEADLAAGTGTMTTAYTETATYSESDLWDGSSVGQFTGNTPAGYYLYDGSDSPVWNYYDTTECSESPCTLVVTTTTTFEASLEVYAASLDHEDYEGVRDAGQPMGADP